MGITHAKVSTKSDGGDTSLVRPSDWNADHIVTDPPALILLEQHTASSSATLDFTTAITSTYDDYMIEIIDLIPVTTNTELWMRYGTGAGPTFDTGANYSYNGLYNGFGDNLTARAASGATKFQLASNIATTANHSTSGTLRVYNPGSALYKRATSEVTSVVSGNFYYWSQHFLYSSTTAVTGVQFLMSSGNIASGTIRMYGIAK